MIRWLADYRDGSGARRSSSSRPSRRPKATGSTARVDVKAGVHVPESQSKTVAGAAELWLECCREGDPTEDPGPLELATTIEYARQMRYCCDPEIGIGKIRLTKLTLADVDAFLRRLREQRGKSAATARKVRDGLGNMLAFAMAQDPPLVARNVLRSGRRRRSKAEREQKDIVIPTKAHLSAMLKDQESPLWFRAFLTTVRSIPACGRQRSAASTGAHRLEGGRDPDPSARGFQGIIGSPKSKAGNRDITMTLPVRDLLQELSRRQGRPHRAVSCSRPGTVSRRLGQHRALSVPPAPEAPRDHLHAMACTCSGTPPRPC